MFLEGREAPKNFNPHSYGWAQSRLPMTWEQAQSADRAEENRRADQRRKNDAIYDARRAAGSRRVAAFGPTFRTNIAVRR